MTNRVALVGPVQNGIQATLLIGSYETRVVHGMFQTAYVPPDLRQWQKWIDAGYTVASIPETAS